MSNNLSLKNSIKKKKWLQVLVLCSSVVTAAFFIYCSHGKSQIQQVQTNENTSEECKTLQVNLKRKRMFMTTTKSGPPPGAYEQLAIEEKQFKEKCGVELEKGPLDF